MPIAKAELIWMNGKQVPWDEARVHVLTHALHYGSSIFEGMRCYATRQGSAVFRMGDHYRRLVESCRVYRMEVPYSETELAAATLDLIRANGFAACYVRPMVFRGYGEMGVNPLRNPLEVVIAVWEWGRYLGENALERGVDVCVSTWQRMAPNTFPARAKTAANYMNSQLIKMEALLNGFAEGIALDVDGYVCEGSGENVFVVKDGTLYTPPLSSPVLHGVTRDTVITLSRDSGLTVREELIPRETLYIADEIFFTGSASEITPIASVDRIPVADGQPGPITRRLQEAFFRTVRGEVEDRYGWLTQVPSRKRAGGVERTRGAAPGGNAARTRKAARTGNAVRTRKAAPGGNAARTRNAARTGNAVRTRNAARAPR
jgi:branched-chain amino acid aminotransferase